MTTELHLPISQIFVPAGRRKLDPRWVQTLKASIAEHGQQQAIEVRQDEPARYRLIFGAHRLAAVSELSDKIRVRVIDPKEFADEAQLRLREIAENLVRRQLSVLDRAVDISAWRDIYEAANGVTKPGPKAKPRTDEEEWELSANFALNFTEAAQQALHISRRSVFLALKVASIAPDVRERIALHDIADNQSELLGLAAEPSHRQVQIADMLMADPALATTVAGAIAIMDRVTPPARLASWEKLSQTFSNLKPTEQDRFFMLHEAAITRWLGGRNA